MKTEGLISWNNLATAVLAVAVGGAKYVEHRAFAANKDQQIQSATRDSIHKIEAMNPAEIGECLTNEIPRHVLRIEDALERADQEGKGPQVREAIELAQKVIRLKFTVPDADGVPVACHFTEDLDLSARFCGSKDERAALYAKAVSTIVGTVSTGVAQLSGKTDGANEYSEIPVVDEKLEPGSSDTPSFFCVGIPLGIPQDK